MNRFRQRKNLALELVYNTRKSIMNLDSLNIEEQYWGLDSLTYAHDDWKIELEGCIKEYLLIRQDPGIIYDHLFDEFDETFEGVQLEWRKIWLADVLYLYILEYMDKYQSRISRLLSLMMSKPDRYADAVTSAVVQYCTPAIKFPYKWVPYCEVVGQLVHEGFMKNNLEWCEPRPVFGILIDVFDEDGNSDMKTLLVRGAAKCVSKLGKATVEHIVQNNWEMNSHQWGKRQGHDVSPADWQRWIKCFEAFGSDTSRSYEVRQEALCAAQVMTCRWDLEERTQDTATLHQN